MPEPQWHLAAAPVVHQAARRLSRHGGPTLHPLVASLSSVLVDADHLVDKFYYARTRDRHVQLVPLHSWEFAALLLIARSTMARSAGFGLLVHYLVDVAVGGYHCASLSLGYRIRHRFRTGYLGDWVLWPHGPRGWREVFHSGSTPETDS